MSGQVKGTCLLDGNLLAALCIPSHIHFERAHHWFGSLPAETRFATCAVTQGTLLRVHMRLARDRSANAAWRALKEIEAHLAHRYWFDDLPYREVSAERLQGPAQITDAWLAELARRQQGSLATLDAALAHLHGDVAVLLAP